MGIQYTVGAQIEAFVQDQLASGRYGSATDVVNAALALMQTREQGLAALDTALQQGLADIETGAVFDADQVFNELDAELAAMAHAAK